MALKKSAVVEDFHGTKVADPYRWMEDPKDPDLGDWIKAQNTATQEFLGDYPNRDKLSKRLAELLDYPKHEMPKRVKDTYFYKMNAGLQNQPILYRQQGLLGEREVLLDPNALSEDGTVALYNFTINKSATSMGYTLSASGSDRQEIRIRNLQTKKDYPEVIKDCRFTNIAWVGEDKFYYTRYPAPGTVDPEDESNYSQIWLHKVGTSQAEDVLVYERLDFKELSFHPMVTDDEKYLIIHVSHGTDSRNRVYYQSLEGESPVVRLLDEGDATYDFIGNDEGVFYFHSNYKANRGRIIAIDINNPQRDNWQEILPEQAEVTSAVSLVNDRFIVTYMQDAYNRVKIFDKQGKYIQEIKFPTLGSVTGIFGKPDEKLLLIGFSSFLYPNTIFRYLWESNELEPIFAGEQTFKPEDYQTRQVFYPSKDGTKIPMFLISQKGLKLDGNNPTLLYGYGGFNISLTPSFSPMTIQWLEMGGVYAIANLRGGSEYGESWHRAGMLENKQNVFDDFISAAKYLIDEGYTQTRKLAIMGRSNGGLLVSACMLQRPDLFGAVICGVPVTDMLRFHKFTVGRYWVPEYGNAQENPDHFNFMYAYSPLHNVEEREYPPILITTADTDDRVVPAHAFKFAATLQEKAVGDNPILVRVETKAGHGHGKPISKVIEEQADTYSFLAIALGL